MKKLPPDAPAIARKNAPGNVAIARSGMLADEASFGYARDFLRNEFVYLILSPRTRGLAIGINLSPSATCNLNCRYCEVDRSRTPGGRFDVNRMITELRQTFELIQGGWLRKWPRYARLPAELLKVRHVALSGDGEPTLSPDFVEATQALVHLRMTAHQFKMVLATNATTLDQPDVQVGLAHFTPQDEIWAKLDGGTQSYVAKINGATISLEKVLANILLIARQRPVVIQSLFPAIDGEEPADAEIAEYSQRLKELKEAGAQIPLVQIYSVNRPAARVGCGHLPLRSLSQIARSVRQLAGLSAEVY